MKKKNSFILFSLGNIYIGTDTYLSQICISQILARIKVGL